MALYKTSFDIIVKNSRLFSIAAPNIGKSWFTKFKALPALTAFENTPKLSSEQWTKLRKEMSETTTGVKAPSLDVIVMQLCNAHRNLDLAKSYLKYLKENKMDWNTALVGKYFQLLFNCRDVLTDSDRKEILSMYDDLRRVHPLLDAITAESCILVLALTERWRETVELLEMLKLSCTASSPSYSAIIIAGFNNGDFDMGWKYLSEAINHQKRIFSECYIACINYYTKNFKQPDICIQEISKLLNFIADHDLMLEKIVMEQIKKTFEAFGWVGTFTTLNTVGICRNCGHQLDSLKLSMEDFSHLRKTVFDRVLVGNDVYVKSTPVELKRFVNYVNKTKPYDVVVDGLNVGYKSKQHSNSHAAQQLAAVVRYFLDKNQVVLVLGRKHMYRWDEQCMNFIKNNSFLFLTGDLSSDDPCLLYAALASGPETKFVSGDLMRQHKFLLRDAALERMFKRWQMNHQCFINFKKEKLQVMPPLNYSPIAQGGENCWHIPYRLPDAPLTESYKPPSAWLCLERVKCK